VSLATIAALARTDTRAALELADLGNQPLGCDPEPAITALDAEVRETSLWLWPFAPRVEYLVRASVAGTVRRASNSATNRDLV
jgi:hypothetical protein